MMIPLIPMYAELSKTVSIQSDYHLVQTSVHSSTKHVEFPAFLSCLSLSAFQTTRDAHHGNIVYGFDEFNKQYLDANRSFPPSMMAWWLLIFFDWHKSFTLQQTGISMEICHLKEETRNTYIYIYIWSYFSNSVHYLIRVCRLLYFIFLDYVTFPPEISPSVFSHIFQSSSLLPDLVTSGLRRGEASSLSLSEANLGPAQVVL